VLPAGSEFTETSGGRAAFVKSAGSIASPTPGSDCSKSPRWADSSWAERRAAPADRARLRDPRLALVL